MKPYFLIYSLILFVSCQQNQVLINTVHYHQFEDFPVYEGDDLGVTYGQSKTTFKLWSPAVQEVKLKIYEQGSGDNLLKEVPMAIMDNGVWEITLGGDWKDKYYTYQVKHDGKWLEEAADPYATAVGINGQRAMIVDFDELKPSGWDQHQRPELKSFSDIILYEAHIRDVSIHPQSGMKNKGKFLALTEENTHLTTDKSVKTGLAHFKEMGITHLHILPAFDFRSVDETKLSENKYNWGYDPQNYHAPEGSYSLNPADGKVRIKEFREMVKALHENKIRVIMDVVYNHTGFTDNSNLNLLVPGYYYRQNKDGSFSNASACGNEVASDRPMVRKFIIWSLKHWVKDYDVDGFRFDLMGIHDIETMNQISKELHVMDPTLFLYGEGWTAGDSPLPLEKRALKNHAKQLNNVAVFSDDIRDGIKGHWSDVHEKGFVGGHPDLNEVVKFGIVASTNHPDIQYDKNRTYAQFPYSDSPQKVIGYVSCHDNNTLYDKLKIANPNASEEDILKMHQLSNAMVLTAQSVPFLHMGVEMKRTKQGVENSYESPDSINQMDWNWKVENASLVDFYQKMIRLRKEHPAFKMPTEKMIQKHLKFLDTEGKGNLVAYTISDNANGDAWKKIWVAYNGDGQDKTMSLDDSYQIVLKGSQINYPQFLGTASGEIIIPAYGAVILVQK